MINDGLWCAFEMCHMGNAGEVVAEHYHVGRAAQDDYAAKSHQKAARATSEGVFKDEILAISLAQRKGDPIVVDRDEGIRPETTAETLAALRPAFKKDGTVTAGNAPGVNDGASALVVMSSARAHALGLTPMARIVGQATSGLAPKFVLMTPVEAVRRVAKKIGWELKDVDLFELNEAFAVQAVAVLEELGIDPRARERQRRRGRARARDRIERLACAHDSALRAEAAQPETRDRDVVPRRGEWCGARGRACLEPCRHT